MLQQFLGFRMPFAKGQPRLGRRAKPRGQNDMAHARGLGRLDHVRLPLAHVQMGRRDQVYLFCPVTGPRQRGRVREIRDDRLASFGL